MTQCWLYIELRGSFSFMAVSQETQPAGARGRGGANCVETLLHLQEDIEGRLQRDFKKVCS